MNSNSPTPDKETRQLISTIREQRKRIPRPRDPKKLIAQFRPRRDRARETWLPKQEHHKTAIDYIYEQIGSRYHACRLNNFEVSRPDQQAAIDTCRDYITNFPRYCAEGRSLFFTGPKGTGKDHLLVATMRGICIQHDHRYFVKFRDGLAMFTEFRDVITTRQKTEDQIVESYLWPALFCVSDPVPPEQPQSDYEKKIFLRIIDGRYRQRKPIAATINIGSREEAEQRMGAQCTDRLFDSAVIVGCNWDSYRQSESAE